MLLEIERNSRKWNREQKPEKREESREGDRLEYAEFHSSEQTLQEYTRASRAACSNRDGGTSGAPETHSPLSCWGRIHSLEERRQVDRNTEIVVK